MQAFGFSSFTARQMTEKKTKKLWAFSKNNFKILHIRNIIY